MSTVHTAIRVNADDHEQIKRLASEHGRSYSRFLADAALGRLADHVTETDQRLTDLEQRIADLERLAGLGALST